jgi:hypothetical protein
MGLSGGSQKYFYQVTNNGNSKSEDKIFLFKKTKEIETKK